MNSIYESLAGIDYERLSATYASTPVLWLSTSPSLERHRSIVI